MKSIWLLVILLSLSGCAFAPITAGEVPAADHAECAALSDKVGPERVLGRAAVGAAKGAAIGLGIDLLLGSAVLRESSFGVSLRATAPSIFLATLLLFAFEGAAQGHFETEDRRAAVYTLCLRDKGHRAY